MQIYIQDVASGAKCWRIWGTLAWFDVKSRYTRTWLGPVWTLASLLFFVAVIGFLYTEILSRDPAKYLPHLAAGWIIWTLAANCVLNSCNAFLNGKRLIMEMKLPLSVHVFRVLFRNVIFFAYHLPVLFVVILFFPHNLIIKMMVLACALFLIVANLFWVAILLGIACTRYRDMFEILTSVMRVLFLMTPVIWMPDMLGVRTYFLYLNPFFHIIEVFRGPLLDQWPHAISWWVLIAALPLGWMAALLALVRFRRRIPFWI